MSGIARQLAVVAWPGFLVAALLEVFVFAFVDPNGLHLPGGGAIGLSANAVYSLAFFVFWLLAAGGCLLSQRLGASAEELNAPPAGRA